MLAGGLLAAALTLASCDSKFEDYNTNPNTPTNATPAMLATNCLRSLWPTFTEKKGYMRDEMLCKYISWTEANDIDLAFNKLGRADFSDMTMLYNVNKMVNKASTERLRNGYDGVGHVIRALKLFDLSLRVGDIPYSEAFRGEEGIIAPVYDSQRDVMLGLLNELETADKELQDADDISGDIVYGGDVDKWRKAANTLELKILINLYSMPTTQNSMSRAVSRTLSAQSPSSRAMPTTCSLCIPTRAGRSRSFTRRATTICSISR